VDRYKGKAEAYNGLIFDIDAILADRSMIGSILLKLHSTGDRAITQHRVTRLVDQCATICKRHRYSWHNYRPRYRFSILAIAAIADR